MKFSLHRPPAIAATITLMALVIAGIVKHAKHGFAFYLGDVAWFTFLTGVVITLALAITALATRARRRRSPRPVTR